MKAGLLTEHIEIWKKTLETNKYGEETETWSKSYETRARLVHDGGSRVISNDEVMFTHSKTFQVRDYVPVGNYDRIKWEGDFYRILNIEPDRVSMNQTIKVELIND
jgi:head-tail adaptor